MRGLLNVGKPAGISSYDVIRRVKPLIGDTPVGHAGTLDPFATGVLVLLLGAATRVVPYIGHWHKCYRARVELGRATDTLDPTGTVVAQADPSAVTGDSLRSALSSLTGEITQTPPAFSAAKVDGVPAYRRARRGQPVELAPRRVTVFTLTLVRYAPPEVELVAEVSSGTYLRALAADLGRRLGVPAMLTALERTGVGPFGLTQAARLDALDAATIARRLVPVEAALADLPWLGAGPRAYRRLRDGRTISADQLSGNPLPGPGPVLVGDGYRRFLFACESDGAVLTPRRLIYDDAARS